jgi:hypothetical protein
MSRVFNPNFINNLINWVITSGVRIVVITMGVFVLLRLFYMVIERAEKIILKEKVVFFTTVETEKWTKKLSIKQN